MEKQKVEELFKNIAKGKNVEKSIVKLREYKKENGEELKQILLDSKIPYKDISKILIEVLKSKDKIKLQGG